MRNVSCVAVALALAACDLGDASTAAPDNTLDDWLAGQEKPIPEDEPVDDDTDVQDDTSDGDDDWVEVFCTPDDDGVPCEVGNDEGVTRCVASSLKCWVCEPGETRDAGCGCGIARVDTCTDDGRWRRGVCDSCVSDPAPVPCGFCGVEGPGGECLGEGVCVPGSVRFDRCDACPYESCAPGSCVGKKFICTDSCEWELVEDCDIRPPQCEGELRRIEKCGECGNIMIECDGCFWQWPETCDEQQECFPGEFRYTDCFGKGCAEGWRSSITCNNNCQWSPPSRCVGCSCSEGSPCQIQEWQDCVYRKPACGKKLVEYTCTVPSAESECDVPLGRKSDFFTVPGNECPDIDCYPGQVRSATCFTADGLGGHQTMKCSNDCIWPTDWSPCEPGGTSCIPGEEKVSSVPCGCGVSYTKTEICNSTGTGWTIHETGREECPECQPGDSETEGCSVSNSCGSKTRTCTGECTWQESDCTQASSACTNGDSRQGSCNSACGPGTASFTCMGCAWVQTTSCYPNTEPACQRGETRQEPCNPEFPQCGYREDYCSSTCQWVEGTCGACG